MLLSVSYVNSKYPFAHMNGAGYAVTGEMLRNADFVHCTFLKDGNSKK